MGRAAQLKGAVPEAVTTTRTMLTPISPLYRLFSQTVRAFLPVARSQTWYRDWELARWLGVSASLLPEIRMGPRYHYRPFSLLKSDGSERRVLAPSPALKTLQRRLLRQYLSRLKIHQAATAFYPGASIASNAERHLGQALIATIDLTDFFESTSADRVRAFFVQQGWQGEALGALMRLCVYRNGLPQGAPTSPCLSNLVNFELDTELNEIARTANARYTRYSDDLTFSWRVEHMPGDFEAMVTDCLRHFGYSIQLRKGWKVRRAADEPQIAGVVLGRDGRLWAAPEVRTEARKLWWQWWWKRDPCTKARLDGYRGFFEMLGR